MITYKQLKDYIQGLGFEEYETVEEYEVIVNKALTLALQTISETVIAPKESIDLINAHGEYDLEEITKEGGIVRFNELETIWQETTEGDKLFNNYHLENGKILHLPEDIVANYTVYYKPIIVQIEDMSDNDPLPIHYRAEHLLPLLVAYHVWLDDEERKAVMYYNEYQQERELLIKNLEKNGHGGKRLARMVGGLPW